MSYTDFITFFLSIIFLVHGASRGFLNSLMGPFSIIVATIASLCYYQITKEIIMSLLIGLIGPFILIFILKFLLKRWAKITNTEIRPNFLSRLLGALLTLTWGWVFIIFTLVLIAVLPSWGKALTNVHDDVTKSASYLIAKPLGEHFFAAPPKNTTAAASVPSNNDAKTLALDPRFQKVLQDPEIQKEIDAHDIVKLMSNPRMIDLTRQIMSDPATMKKVLTIYSNQGQAQSYFVTTNSSNN